MLKYQKRLLTGWLIIITIGIIVVGVYNSKRSALLEKELKKEIEEAEEEIRRLKEEIEQLKKEVSVESKEIPEIYNSDWKIYKNDKYRYQIKYPKNFEVIVRNSSVEIRGAYPYLDWVRIEVLSNPQMLSLKEWLYKFTKLQEIEEGKLGEVVFIKEIEIGKEKGIRIAYWPLTKQGEKQDITYLSKGALIYAISIKETGSNIPTRIISTFEVIEASM